MFQIIAGVIQIIYLLLKNRFEKDAEVRKKREELHAQAKEAIKSGDISAVNNILVRLRK